MNAVLLVTLLVLTRPSAPQTFSPDAEGFIRNWVVLAPIPIEGESGADEIDKEMVAGEATIAPRAGDKATARGRALTWTAHQTDDYFIDFLKSFGKERGEYVAGYAVAYITAGAEMKVTLARSTNDQGKAWLNGKPVFRFADTRTLEKDSDRIEVTLVKGQNVLVLKIINEVNNWQGCARFLSNGAPVKDISIAAAPVGK
jgi:hypothetical protein